MNEEKRKYYLIGGVTLCVLILFVNVQWSSRSEVNLESSIRSSSQQSVNFIQPEVLPSVAPVITEAPELPPSTLKPVHSKRWIVVTSVNSPTEDVKRLASQPGWTVVVVADTKTPKDWNLPGAHFLSVDDQLNLGLKLPSLLPFKTYTRKNVGYLYAIMNGAEWIYDTDDDNKPYGLGMDQFDYNDRISGLRYRAVRDNSTISERLFNPYRYFGHSQMWPRGFPLEYLREHTNGDDRYLLCREMRPAAVQQGIVHKDPDVDAVYRLLHADPQTGLNERFNQFAPSVVLERGTYSPWNSQNTLFNKNAFFTMFLPTTVEFRVTDIWRSFFSQKLLHLIGESIAFCPVNAIQIRNAHDYLADFQDEKAVYLKAGQIVEFLSSWICSATSTQECTLLLAREFQKREFWKEGDVALIETWIKDLETIGYEFPALASSSAVYEEEKMGDVRGNCRKANLHLKTDLSTNYTEPQATRADSKIEGIQEILAWCGANSTNGSSILPSYLLARNHANRAALTNKLETVLVLSTNSTRRESLGLLQRLYEPFFGVFVICGDVSNQKQNTSGEIPPLKSHFNYIHLTKEESQDGQFAYYCISKVRELRLQNIKGYYFLSDDVVFNLWNGNNMTAAYSAPNTKQSNQPLNATEGEASSRRVVELLGEKYSQDERIQGVWREFGKRLIDNGVNGTINDYMMSFSGIGTSKLYYIPSSDIEFFADVSEIFSEARLQQDMAMTKLMTAAKSSEKYDEILLAQIPAKISNEDKILFCNQVVSSFRKNLFQ